MVFYLSSGVENLSNIDIESLINLTLFKRWFFSEVVDKF